MTIKTLLISLFLVGSIGVNHSQSISLVGKLSYTNLPVHDVWSYQDSATGNYYALLCASTSGMRVIDISNASSPVQVGTISGSGVNPIDVKTWRNYAYVVAENTATTGKIIDLSDPTTPVVVGTFPGGHNITISDSGYLYLSAPGLRIFDLNLDPTAPNLVFTDNTCQGHDITIIGNNLYDFSNNCGTRIFDISNPISPVSLGIVTELNTFHHSGAPSIDGNYLFVCDELATPSENDISVWDISNLSAPIKVDSFIDPTSYVHNLYVDGNYAYVSYYRAGFRVFDISNPAQINLVAEYDTDSTLSGPGYGGNFGLHINKETGVILASDEGNGLYIFSFSGLTSIKENAINSGTAFNFYPNPATENIFLDFEESVSGTFRIINSNGQIVKTFSFYNKKQLVVPTNKYPIGLYQIQIITASAIQSKVLVIQK